MLVFIEGCTIHWKAYFKRPEFKTSEDAFRNLPDAWIGSQIPGPQEQDGDLKKSVCVFNFLLQYLLLLASKENLITQENKSESELK